MTTELLSTFRNGVLTLTLNRPARANAFDLAAIDGLRLALEEAEKDSRVGCVVLTGANRVFSSGQDLTEMERYGGQISYGEHLQRSYNPLILQIRNMGKPLLAAVNGPCAGAALGVALACDLRIVHPRAYFVVGFSGIGLAPDSGVSLLLPVFIGVGRAQESFYSNQPISAWRAYRWGMANQIVWLGFEARVQRTAERLASGPREAFALGKRAFNRAMLPHLEEALEFEGILQDKAGKTEEHKRRVKAFFERKK